MTRGFKATVGNGIKIIETNTPGRETEIFSVVETISKMTTIIIGIKSSTARRTKLGIFTSTIISLKAKKMGIIITAKTCSNLIQILLMAKERSSGTDMLVLAATRQKRNYSGASQKQLKKS